MSSYGIRGPARSERAVLPPFQTFFAHLLQDGNILRHELERPVSPQWILPNAMSKHQETSHNGWRVRRRRPHKLVRRVFQDERNDRSHCTHPEVVERYMSADVEHLVDEKEIDQSVIEVVIPVDEGKVDPLTPCAEVRQHFVRPRLMETQHVVQVGSLEVCKTSSLERLLLIRIYGDVTTGPGAVVSMRLANAERRYSVGHSDLECPGRLHRSNEIVEHLRRVRRNSVRSVQVRDTIGRVVVAEDRFELRLEIHSGRGYRTISNRAFDVG